MQLSVIVRNHNYDTFINLERRFCTCDFLNMSKTIKKTTSIYGIYSFGLSS